MYVACYRVANTDMHALHAIFNSDNDYDNYYFTLKTNNIALALKLLNKFKSPLFHKYLNVVYLSLFHLVHLRPICDV